MNAPPPANTRVPLLTLMAVFFRVGLTSFGGSTAAWVHREIVQKQHWLDEEHFLTALTLAQVLPGANPVNLALYVGSMLRGAAGGIAAATGLVGPAFVVILLLGAFYAHFGDTPLGHAILAGLAAVGIGMTLMVGAMLSKSVRNLVQGAIATAVFIAVGLLHWPTIPVVVAVTPISIGIQMLARRREATP